MAEEDYIFKLEVENDRDLLELVFLGLKIKFILLKMEGY